MPSRPYSWADVGGGGGGAAEVPLFPEAALPAPGDFTQTQFGTTDGACSVSEINDSALRLTSGNYGDGHPTDYCFARMALPAATPGVGQTIKVAMMFCGWPLNIGQTTNVRLQFRLVMGITNADPWFGLGIEDLDNPDDVLLAALDSTSWATAPTITPSASSQSVDLSQLYFHRWRNGATWTLDAIAICGSVLTLVKRWTANVNGDAGLMGFALRPGDNATLVQRSYARIHGGPAIVDMSGSPHFPPGSP